MKQHSFLSIYLTFCLILSGCSAESDVTSPPTVAPSLTMRPFMVFSSSTVDHIIEQSNLGEGQITACAFSSRFHDAVKMSLSHPTHQPITGCSATGNTSR